MLFPLAIAGHVHPDLHRRHFFVRLGPSGSIMGALYKGLIVTGVLSLGRLAAADLLDRRAETTNMPFSAGARFNRFAPYFCRRRGSCGDRADRLDHEYLYRNEFSALSSRFAKASSPATAPM